MGILACLLIVAVVVWYMFGAGVHDHRPRTDQIGNYISTAGTQQQDAISDLREGQAGLKISEDSAGRISKGIGGIAHSIEKIESEIGSGDDKTRDDASLIEECQRIARQIRARDEIKE
jgi:hypothetical protein